MRVTARVTARPAVCPRLSVIVPLRGAEEHVEEFISSLRRQTLPGIEVLLVGPAQEVVRDPGWRVVAPATDDAGAARNAGAAHATGAYLAFADPRTLIPADAYRRLVETLDVTGSDMACGKARWLSGPASTAQADVLRTHVTKNPRLLHDTSATTKVFRRAFWEEHGFAFPEGAFLNEPGDDFPVTVPAHVLSRSTDVLAETVCLVRAGGRPSGGDTARRLAARLEVTDLVARHAPDLKRAYDIDVAESADLASVLDTAPAETLLGFAPALGRLHPEAVATLPALRRLQLFLTGHGMTAELDELRRFAQSRMKDARVLRRGARRRRWSMDYPLRDRLPAHLFDATHDLRLHARVDDVRHRGGGRLRIAGHALIAHLPSRRSRIEVWLQKGGKRIELPIRRTFRPDVTADSRQSAVSHDHSGFELDIEAGALPPGRWSLHARVSARGVTRSARMTGARDAGERDFPAGPLRVTLTRDRGLILQISGGPDQDVGTGDQVTGLRWTDAHELVLTGEGAGRTDRIVLERGTERHAWPVTWNGDRWTATIGATESGLPLRSGTWRALSGGDRVRLSPELVADLPPAHTTGLHEISVCTDRDATLNLVVRPALTPAERGPYATRRRRDRPRRWGRLRDAALFDSYGGTQYSCNPRAISEELGRRHPGVELIWVTRDGQFAVPPGVRTVLYGSRAHEEALHTSRFVVANRRTQPSWYRKRPGQLYVQTWHGTPLKRLGRDVQGMPRAERIPEEDLVRQVGMWDVLISPNPFSTPILRRAFGYEREVLESGYPRNDVLLRPGPGRDTRRRLGIPNDRRVVLYAPTWRDDEIDRPGLALDVDQVAAALGEDDVLLVRAHYLVADRLAIPGAALDVSKFPDMADLLAATDVLVTDYSSAMFDFACTGRPIVLFAYDLERYRDEVRGFYVGIEEMAPGPLVRTADELIDVLKYEDFNGFKNKYQGFAARFCPWDDGNAAARVVQRMLPPDRPRTAAPPGSAVVRGRRATAAVPGAEMLSAGEMPGVDVVPGVGVLPEMPGVDVPPGMPGVDVVRGADAGSAGERTARRGLQL
jgi:CDP-glycerol glycerophosphotransferase